MTTIDEELAALRHLDEELARQLNLHNEQEAERAALLEACVRRTESLNAERADVKRRAALIQKNVASMEAEVKEWSQAEAECSAACSTLQALQSQVMERLEAETNMQNQISAAPSVDAVEKKRIAAGLQDVLNFLSNYLLSITFTRLSERGGLEYLSGDAETEKSVKGLLDFMELRERNLHEVCGECDYRNEESLRLESSLKTQVEQSLMDVVDLQSTKQAQLEAIAHAFSEERHALMRIKTRLETEAKEIEFHLKRGTMGKRETKMTSAELKLQDKVSGQQDEVRKLLESFEQMRNEKAQLEREAELSLNKLLRNREEQQKEKVHCKARLDDVRKFRSVLEQERTEWIATKKDMQELVVVLQNRIRAADLTAAAARAAL